MRWHGGSFFRLRDARGSISIWVQFRKLGTLSFGKSAKSIRKILKLACGSDSEYFAHNADFPELRVTTLPAKFTQIEILPRAVYWLFARRANNIREQCTRIYVCVMGRDVV